MDLAGKDLTFYRFIVRELIARGLPIIGFYFYGYISYIWYFTYLLALTKERRALHDIIAGTQIVVRNKQEGN